MLARPALGWISAVPPIVEQLSLIKQRVASIRRTSRSCGRRVAGKRRIRPHVERLRGEHRLAGSMVKALNSTCLPEPAFRRAEGGLYLGG